MSGNHLLKALHVASGKGKHVQCDANGKLLFDAENFDIRDLSHSQDSVEVRQSTHSNLKCDANMMVNGTLLGLGQVGMAASIPVAIASNQSALTVQATALDVRALAQTSDAVAVWHHDGAAFRKPLVTTDGAQLTRTHLKHVTVKDNESVTANSTFGVIQEASSINVYGTCDTATSLTIQFSYDGSTYYDSSFPPITIPNGGFGMGVPAIAKYTRMKIADNCTITLHATYF